MKEDPQASPSYFGSKPRLIAARGISANRYMTKDNQFSLGVKEQLWVNEFCRPPSPMNYICLLASFRPMSVTKKKKDPLQRFSSRENAFGLLGKNWQLAKRTKLNKSKKHVIYEPPEEPDNTMEHKEKGIKHFEINIPFYFVPISIFEM